MAGLRQRDRLVTPQTWELIRAACLLGFSARVVAERYGVGEAALRKRARLEGWTKRAYAEARAVNAGAPISSPPGSAATPLPDPTQQAETALIRAAEALAAGRAADAVAMVRAAEAVRVGGQL